MEIIRFTGINVTGLIAQAINLDPLPIDKIKILLETAITKVDYDFLTRQSSDTRETMLHQVCKKRETASPAQHALFDELIFHFLTCGANPELTDILGRRADVPAAVMTRFAEYQAKSAAEQAERDRIAHEALAAPRAAQAAPASQRKCVIC